MGMLMIKIIRILSYILQSIYISAGLVMMVAFTFGDREPTTKSRLLGVLSVIGYMLCLLILFAQ
jgi:hypothetical protein